MTRCRGANKTERGATSGLSNSQRHTPRHTQGTSGHPQGISGHQYGTARSGTGPGLGTLERFWTGLGTPRAPRAGLEPPELLPVGRRAQAAAPLPPLAPRPLQVESTIPESEEMDGWHWPAWEIVQAQESTQFPCCLPHVQPLNRPTSQRKGRSRKTARPRLCRCGQLYMIIMLKAKMNSD